MAEREPTGIQGFDNLIEGGLVKNSITLVSGSPGTGKSILSQQFVYTGCTEYDQPCLYISFEQRIPEIYEQAKRFGWDFEKLEKKGLAKFVFIDISQRMLKSGQSYIDLIKDYSRDLKPKRLVIDSLVPLSSFPISTAELSTFGLLDDFDQLLARQIQEDLLVRMQIHKIMMVLKDLKTTSVTISETPKDSQWLSRDQVSEFMADAVLTMHYLGIGTESNRSMIIEKMRGTKHSEDVLSIQITDKGIVIQNPNKVLSKI